MQRAEYKATVSDDGLQVRLEVLLDGQVSAWSEMDAAELSGVIEMLAGARSRMAERFPMDLDHNPRLAFVNDPRWVVYRSTGTEVPVAFRHDGYGWIMFHLPESSAEELARTIRPRLPGLG